MISYLKGIIEKISDNSVIIEVNGVGYNVICSSRTISAASNISGIVCLFTELIMREDSWTIYGFISEREKFWFNTLTSVQGVGGKAAVSILSALSDDDIYNAFLSDDKNLFTRADGIGAKLATRITSELKDKIVGKIECSTVSTSTQQIPRFSVVNDTISALMNLGYQKSDIYKAISFIKIENDAEFDILFKQILTKLSSGA